MVFRKNIRGWNKQPMRSMLLSSGCCSSIKYAAWRQRQKPTILHQYGCFKSADSSLLERLVRKVLDMQENENFQSCEETESNRRFEVGGGLYG